MTYKNMIHLVGIAGLKVRRPQRRKIVCDAEKIAQLNKLGKTKPFCSWQKARDNDPL
jgi:hypothetical protein